MKGWSEITRSQAAADVVRRGITEGRRPTPAEPYDGCGYYDPDDPVFGNNPRRYAPKEPPQWCDPEAVACQCDAQSKIIAAQSLFMGEVYWLRGCPNCFHVWGEVA